MAEPKALLEAYLLPDKCFFLIQEKKSEGDKWIGRMGQNMNIFLVPKMISQSWIYVRRHCHEENECYEFQTLTIPFVTSLNSLQHILFVYVSGEWSTFFSVKSRIWKWNTNEVVKRALFSTVNIKTWKGYISALIIL